MTFLNDIPIFRIINELKQYKVNVDTYDPWVENSASISEYDIKMKDDYYKSTLVSVRIGQMLEIGMVVFGLCFGYFMLSFIAVFLFVAAESELNLVRLSSDVVEE